MQPLVRTMDILEPSYQLAIELICITTSNIRPSSTKNEDKCSAQFSGCMLVILFATSKKKKKHIPSRMYHYSRIYEVRHQLSKENIGGNVNNYKISNTVLEKVVKKKIAILSVWIKPNKSIHLIGPVHVLRIQLKSKAETSPKIKQGNKTSSYITAQIAGTHERCQCECSFYFTYMYGVCSCLHLCLNICIHLWACLLCGHMFTGAHGELKLLSILLNYSQFCLLRQGLSLNL